MPKQLVNLIGILVSVAVLALGVFLVAMPLVTQALAVNGQAQQVAQTNTLYQSQVDALTKAKANKAATDASVATLRAQIPQSQQLDDVFGVVARASETTGATIKNITAGASAPFVTRSSVAAGPGSGTPAPAPSPTATAGGIVGKAQGTAGQANASTAQTDAAAGTATGTGPTQPSTSGQGRTQISFSISVTAANLDQVSAFLDALRSGPRLLSNITSTVGQNGTGFQVQVTALTYVDGAVATTGGAK